MRIYLDNCAFNRPFDNQSYIRIRLESEAKLYLQNKIKIGETELVWSYILDIENDQNPFKEKRITIDKWKSFAIIDIAESVEVITIANQLMCLGIKAKDALHVASAIQGKADYFVTTDDKLIKKLSSNSHIVVINPINLAGMIDEYNY